MSFTLDDTEDAVYEVAPAEDVYSFLMFIGPTEKARANEKEHSITCDVIMAYCLVSISLLMQGLFLYCIYNSVVGDAVDFEDAVMYKPDDPSQCNPGTSLCLYSNNSYSCAPPTVKLTGRWEELDTDGDGIWTREEVIKAQKALQCKYIVNPVEVFDVFVDFIKAREKIIWIHPTVKNGESIPKPYFTYASGDIIMCGYRNEKMCPNLMERGYFDAALKHNTVPRVGNTIQSALKYCNALLEEGGMCERSLPSTYSVWKVRSDGMCGKKSYNKFVYKHPTDGSFKSMVSVDYAARESFSDVLQPLFRVYKTAIISLWVLAMVFAYRDLLISICWVVNVQTHGSLGPGHEDDDLEIDEEGKITVKAVDSCSRNVVAVVTLLRCIILIVLAIVGTSLLLQSPEYMSLIFDAVSLVFVIDVQSILYTQLLRQTLREATENINPMIVNKVGPSWITTRPGVEDMLWLLVVIVLSIGIMDVYYRTSVFPMGEALRCTCLSQGEDCDEANRFSYDFWYHYWSKATPKVFKDVAILKKAYESEGNAASLLQVRSLPGVAGEAVAFAASLGVPLDVATTVHKTAARALRAVSRVLTHDRA